MRSPFLAPLLLIVSCSNAPQYPEGGYAYPLSIPDKDTNYYSYASRNKSSRKDSLYDAFVFESYRALDECNLSLRPMGYDVFRLSYNEALNPAPIVISLTPYEIVVKIANSTEEFIKLPDTNRLSPVQRIQVRVLDQNYPLDEKKPNRSLRKQHYLDSLGTLYPQMYVPAFYFSLLQKEFAHSKPIFTYTKKSVRISRVEYEHLVSEINASGYWNLPVKVACQEDVFDGWGFVLEANTAQKYNMVSACSCGEPDSSRFKKACQDLIHSAGMDNRIHLYYDPKTDTLKRHIVIEDVQLEDVKEPPKRMSNKHRKHPQNASPNAK